MAKRRIFAKKRATRTTPRANNNPSPKRRRIDFRQAKRALETLEGQLRELLPDASAMLALSLIEAALGAVETAQKLGQPMDFGPQGPMNSFFPAR